MRGRLGVLVGFGAGYVLGAKAGRDRYEQLRRLYENVQASPAFQKATGKAKDAVGSGLDQAKDIASGGVSKVTRCGEGPPLDERPPDRRPIGSPTPQQLISRQKRSVLHAAVFDVETGLFEVVAEFLAAGRVPQLRERLRFDLPDALARHAELLADLFERARLTVDQTEAQPDHFLLATGERVEHGFELLLQELERGALERDDRIGVLDEVAEV